MGRFLRRYRDPSKVRAPKENLASGLQTVLRGRVAMRSQTPSESPVSELCKIYLVSYGKLYSAR
jgi:hypothetical protein